MRRMRGGRGHSGISYAHGPSRWSGLVRQLPPAAGRARTVRGPHASRGAARAPASGQGGPSRGGSPGGCGGSNG
eukprot:11142339-Alexandrium_andersonii.AAC.1